MKSKIAIPLGLIILMSTLGIVYAGWTDQVLIEGVAEMGSLTLAYDVEEPPICTEFHKVNDEGPLIPGEYLGKDVAQCRAWYEELIVDPHTEKEGYKELYIEIYNAYPSLHVRTTYILHNIGTVPIIVYDRTFSGEKYTSAGEWVCDLIFEQLGPQDYVLWEDYNDNGVIDGDDKPVIEFRITDGIPVQIDPCTVEKREVDIHFLQDAQQCHHYLLHGTIFGIQWNKYYETIG